MEETIGVFTSSSLGTRSVRIDITPSYMVLLTVIEAGSEVNMIISSLSYKSLKIEGPRKAPSRGGGAYIDR